MRPIADRDDAADDEPAERSRPDETEEDDERWIEMHEF